MMKLSTMLKVNSTIDAHWYSRIAEQILEPWEHDQSSARFFRASANFVYTFRTQGKDYVLRFTDSAERSAAAVEGEMVLLQWLTSKGLIVTPPIASKNGRSVEKVETDLGTFYGVVFPLLQGVQVDFDELNAAQFTAWGAALGKLHATLHMYPEPGLTARSTWKEQLYKARIFLPEDAPAVIAEYEYLSSFLDALPITETNYGLIHGDFELDNLFWQGNSIAMLDFDDCAYSWYIADIACALRDLFKINIDLNHPSFQAFIHGYSQHYPLDEPLLLQLPMWMRVVNLLQHARLLRAIDIKPAQNYPDWCNSLLLKLGNGVQSYKASLLTIH